MKKFSISILFSLVAMLLAIPMASFGATSDSKPASCFDYYRFQSVQVSLGATKDSYKPGETITFKGDITNENNYPVIDGYVFARIAQKNPDYIKYGSFIIDEIMPLQKVTLNSKERQAQEFSWTVPQNAPTGDYRIDYFFSVGKKFNLGGLPFSNEVVIGTTNFNVASESVSKVFFDRTKTRINNQPYYHIGNWAVFEQGKSVTITQPITNTFNQAKETTVTYDIFYWDSLNETDKISTKQEIITLPANKSKDLIYKLDKMEKTVYYLRITAKSGDQKSIINLRFVSEGNSPRLNYPAITKFPIKLGEQATLFSCYHNTSNLVSEGKVIVTLTDKNNQEVSKTEYNGKIASNMAVTARDFIATKDYDYLKLSAQVLDNSGNQIDSYETVYDCSMLSFSQCKQAGIVNTGDQNKTETWNGKWSSKNMIFFAVAVLIILIILIAILLFKKRKLVGENINAVILIMAFLFGMTAFSQRALGYNERSVAVSKNNLYVPMCSTQNAYAVESGIITVTHNLGMSSGGTTVNVGEPINFYYGDSEIFFFGTGGVSDSPYGKWCNNLTDFCFLNGPNNRVAMSNWMQNSENANYVLQTTAWGSASRAFTTFTGVKPAVGNAAGQLHMSSSNPSVISCSLMNCTALTSGTATLTANIPATRTRAWLLADYKIGNNPSVIERIWMDVLDRFGASHSVCMNESLCASNPNCDDSVVSVPAATVSWNVTVVQPPPCTPISTAFNASNSSVTPASVPNGSNFNVKCDYGSTAIDGISVQTTASTNPCTWSGWDGTAAIFTCVANHIGSNQDVSCLVNNVYPGANYCSRPPTTITQKITVTDPEDCNPPCVAGRVCCRTHGRPGVCRVSCSSCTTDASCGAGECCNKETSVCTTDQLYCGARAFSLTADNVLVTIGENPGNYEGTTRVKVISNGGFRPNIDLDVVSTTPDNNLKDKISFTLEPISYSNYNVGAILHVIVSRDFITQTRKAYRAIIKGTGGGLTVNKEIQVDISRPGYQNQ